MAPFARAQWDDALLKPFVIDHRAASSSPADLSFLHEAPAGKDGFSNVQGGHLVKPSGEEMKEAGINAAYYESHSRLTSG